MYSSLEKRAHRHESRERAACFAGIGDDAGFIPALGGSLSHSGRGVGRVYVRDARSIETYGMYDGEQFSRMFGDDSPRREEIKSGCTPSVGNGWAPGKRPRPIHPARYRPGRPRL